jgi:hypothetical protein
MLFKIAVFSLATVLSIQVSAQTALNNEVILKLASAGVSSDALVRIINTQTGTYSTSPVDLAALQKAGVGSEVVAAVVSHQNGPIAATPPAVLRDGTAVRMRLMRTLSSAQVQTGDKVDFDVLDDIRVGDLIVIPRGSKAIGSVTEAEQKKRMGRGGKLNLVLEYVRLADGTKVAMRAQSANAGAGHVGAMTAGMVATSLVVWPAAPFFLMMHGKDAVIPEGTEITAYVDGDTRIP